MRYWLLVILMNVLFYFIVKHVAPEWYGSPGYYAGQIICTLIAAVITWRDPPDWLDGILLGVIEFGVLIAGIIFFVWGIGYKLAFWGQHYPNTIYASANDVILPNLALGTGVLIAGWVYIRYLKH
ncbi:hypothetical protein ACH6XI_17185 [Klebsiella pneumoniae]|uniref:hypothetical protein n=1 Tax=Klebsiella pneumoniae complex TaxID=3390273 RepID=UPI000DE76677|nr:MULTISPECIES: hypothetical protein [Klebsiella]MCL2986398.1 hypothetical protein [Klebsiella pneumoniae]MCL3144867.1 hypothetical protein [Klebsiella pneumoniae]MDG0491723.1 hypothetical protein [Klebsiella variicola]UFH12769.1 hypothetical protein LOX64_26260 [Klebsiella pneumoniae]URI50346.1 hypothetical protein M3X90_26815 [Klebsiella pneumoniae]